MTYHWDQDADTIAGLPAATTRRRMYAEELGPRWEPQPVTEPFPFAPRAPQVVKCLAHLAGMVDVWEARGQLRGLDSYLARRVPGDTHPLAWARQYRDYQDAVSAGADMLRHPHGGAS